MITIKLYSNGRKLKSKSISYHGGTHAATNQEIFDIIQHNPLEDIRIIDINDNRKDITAEYLPIIIKTLELNSPHNNTIDLNKVIRAGGFIPYIQQLERIKDISSR